MLDLTRLRVIDAVARHGSVTAAAKELHYSQPSVSHHLARLEDETGAKLLPRVGRGIRLTQAGQLLADRAAEIIGRIDAADAELSAHDGFEPRIAYTSDDIVVMQALVAAGLGVTTIPGLALRAHSVEGTVATKLPQSPRRIYAATYGEPPDPPATAALLTALAEA